MKNISLVIFGIIVACILAESGLRFYFSRHINYDMEMWKYATTLKRPVSDKRVHVHLPNKSELLMGVKVNINSQGIRDHEYTYTKPKGIFRILAIGDSFTLGWGVSEDLTFPKLLEQMFNQNSARKTEVINYGVGNYNTEQELAAFLIDGVKYQPDLILLGIYINDAEPVQNNSQDFFTKHSYFAAFVAQRYFQLRSIFSAKYKYGQYYKLFYQGELWDAYTKVIDDFAIQTKKRNIPMLAVILPDLRDLSRNIFEVENHKVLQRFSDNGVTGVSLFNAFSGIKESTVWVAKDDPHPNVLAHKIIADHLITDIRNILNWSRSEK